MNITKTKDSKVGLYKCEDCGAVFAKGEEIYWDWVDDCYGGILKSFEECPNCGNHEYYDYDEDTDTE